MTNNTLAEALKPFAAVADEFFEEASDDMRPFHPCSLGEFRRARDALAILRASTDAAAVAWQRFHPSEGRWMACVDADDMAYYAGKGQKTRALYAHPPVADAAVAGEGATLRCILNTARQDSGSKEDLRTALRVIASFAEKALSHPAPAEPFSVDDVYRRGFWDALATSQGALRMDRDAACERALMTFKAKNQIPAPAEPVGLTDAQKVAILNAASILDYMAGQGAGMAPPGEKTLWADDACIGIMKAFGFEDAESFGDGLLTRLSTLTRTDEAQS